MFGAHFTPMTNEEVENLAKPPTGGIAECIYHQYYDSQLFTSATTLTQSFFKTSNTDNTITNLPQGGQLPAPQLFQIYDVTCDILPITPVSSLAVADSTGILNDMGLMLFGGGQRGTWLINISNKNYGPYSLTTLHGTGGPTGWGWAYGTAAAISRQFARNDPSPGWNYLGRMIIPQQVNFYIELDWAAVSTLAAGNPYVRISLFGVLNRRTL